MTDKRFWTPDDFTSLLSGPGIVARKGSTPLHYITDEKEACTLVQEGLDVYPADFRNCTPLHRA